MSQTHELDTDAVPCTDDLAPDYEAETDAALCPACDLLAWHEQPCEVAHTLRAIASAEGKMP